MQKVRRNGEWVPAGRDGTILVAAQDAPTRWKEAADVVAVAGDAGPQITALLSQGSVELSPGTFDITTPIQVTKISHGITGQGWDTVLRLGFNQNKYVIDFVPETGEGIRAAFRNFTVDGRGDTQSQGIGGGIHAIGAVQSVFEFIHFLNCAENGLWLDSFGGNGGGAFGHHNKVISCLFDATLASVGIGRGLLLTGTDENHVSSEFQFLGGTGTPTFAIRDQSGLNKYISSTFVGGRNNMGGIELRDGRRGMISLCQFDGVSGDNIFVASSGDHILTNNIFTSVADQVSIEGSDGQYSGIHLEYGVTNCVVTGNIMDTSATDGRTRSFIRERAMGDSGGNIIRDNNGTIRGTLAQTAYDLESAMSNVGANYVNGAAVLTDSSMVVVKHGEDATTPRPVASAVYWSGTVPPENAVQDDLWIGGA